MSQQKQRDVCRVMQEKLIHEWVLMNEQEMKGGDVYPYLDAAQRRRVERHVRSCAGCRKVAQESIIVGEVIRIVSTEKQVGRLRQLIEEHGYPLLIQTLRELGQTDLAERLERLPPEEHFAAVLVLQRFADGGGVPDEAGPDEVVEG